MSDNPCPHYEKCLERFSELETTLHKIDQQFDLIKTEIREIRELLTGMNGFKGIVYKVNILWILGWVMIVSLPAIGALAAILF